jgi:hypothetical protein
MIPFVSWVKKQRLTGDRSILKAVSFMTSSTLKAIKQTHAGFLNPLRQWLDQIEIRDPKLARTLAKLIPAQCPFERDIILFGQKVGHLPPLCKLNPLYEQLVSLRFRSLCYLADVCGEDIRSYC